MSANDGKRRRVKVNQRALVEKLLARYATEHVVFRELVQNSDDARSSVALISVTESNISLLNDGRPFSDEDFERVSKIAEGNPDVECVGMFGVGFYSCFAVSEEPSIVSSQKALTFSFDKEELYYKTQSAPTDPFLTAQQQTFLRGYHTQLGPSSSGDSTMPWWTSHFFLPLAAPLPKIDADAMRSYLAASLYFSKHLRALVFLYNGRELFHLRKNIHRHRSIPFTLTTDKLPMFTCTELVSQQLAISSIGEFLLVTASIDVAAPPSFAEECAKLLRKPLPLKTKASFLLPLSASHDSLAIADGLIFVGLATSQTTGCHFHLAAHLFPTIERTSIDFHGPLLGQWNRAILEASGFVLRQYFTSQPPDQQAMLLKLLQFFPSAPSAQVQTHLLKGFFSPEQALFLHIQGHRIALDHCHLPLYHIDRLLGNIQAYAHRGVAALHVIPSEMAADTNFFTASGMCRPISHDLILQLFEQMTLLEHEVSKALDWAFHYESELGSAFVNRFIRSLSYRNGRNITQRLEGVSSYAASPLTKGVPLPPTVLALGIAEHLSPKILGNYFGTAMTFKTWVDWFIKQSPADLRAWFEHDNDTEILKYLARHHPFSLATAVKTKLIQKLKSVACIPTTQGLRMPSTLRLPSFFASSAEPQITLQLAKSVSETTFIELDDDGPSPATGSEDSFWFSEAFLKQLGVENPKLGASQQGGGLYAQIANLPIQDIIAHCSNLTLSDIEIKEFGESIKISGQYLLKDAYFYSEALHELVKHKVLDPIPLLPPQQWSNAELLLLNRIGIRSTIGLVDLLSMIEKRACRCTMLQELQLPTLPFREFHSSASSSSSSSSSLLVDFNVGFSHHSTVEQYCQTLVYFLTHRDQFAFDQYLKLVEQRDIFLGADGQPHPPSYFSLDGEPFDSLLCPLLRSIVTKLALPLQELGIGTGNRLQFVINQLLNQELQPNRLISALEYLSQKNSSLTGPMIKHLKAKSWIPTQAFDADLPLAYVGTCFVFQSTQEEAQVDLSRYHGLFFYMDFPATCKKAIKLLDIRTANAHSNRDLINAIIAMPYALEAILARAGLPAYLSLLSEVADGTSKLPDKIKSQLTKLAILPARRPSTPTLTLVPAGGCYLMDNIDYATLLDPLLSPPGISDAISQFYNQQFGCKWLTQSVQVRNFPTDNVGFQPSPRCQDLLRRIRERTKLLLHDRFGSPLPELRSNAAALLASLQVLETQKVTTVISLDAKSVNLPDSACSTCTLVDPSTNGPQKTTRSRGFSTSAPTLYLLRAQELDYFDVGAAISRFLTAHSSELYTSIFAQLISSTTEGLRRKGWPVDRFLVDPAAGDHPVFSPAAGPLPAAPPPPAVTPQKVPKFLPADDFISAISTRAQGSLPSHLDGRTKPGSSTVEVADPCVNFPPLKKLGKTVRGIEIYVQSGYAQGLVVLNANKEELNQFAVILNNFQSIGMLHQGHFAIFLDHDYASIAFNQDGFIFFNFRYYLDVHVSGSASLNTRICSWFVTACHELAHNHENLHNSHFAGLMQKYIVRFFDDLCKNILGITSSSSSSSSTLPLPLFSISSPIQSESFLPPTLSDDTATSSMHPILHHSSPLSPPSPTSLPTSIVSTSIRPTLPASRQGSSAATRPKVRPANPPKPASVPKRLTRSTTRNPPETPLLIVLDSDDD